ncbi:unnamed protein product [Auanema sp. JU1783]|nr:unnamed protein product [Auanema sp. JU1783]
MPFNKKLSQGDNPELTEERLRATFDTDELAATLRGGKRALEKYRYISEKITSYPELNDAASLGHLDRVEKVNEQTRKMRELFQKLPEICDPMNPAEVLQVIRDVMGVEGYPLSLHTLMFVPTIQNQADEEQQEWWLWKALKGEILGTYAQTEMGHGTNLKKIETCATYDKSTQEFVLYSPSSTSLKWWPGGLGVTCNHVILVANLIIDAHNYGPHNFFVQIRDTKTHQPIPGVRVGDIGSKMGVKGIDNGYLGFDNVRIPRRNMLMKHSKVEVDGTYVKPANAKIGYTTMVYMRSEVVNHASIHLMAALTIAVRYGCVRRQGEITPGAGEVKILDYQTQQHRLFPQIARTFAFHFAGHEIRNFTTSVLESVKKGEVNSLADVHGLSCCLKAVATFQSTLAIEQCRMACGGHGYSDASNLPTLYACEAGACTYEGENIVMLLQTARFLMRSAQLVRNGEPVSATMAYLNKSNKHSLVDRIPEGDGSHYLLDFEYIARTRVFNAYDRLQHLLRSGMSAEEAWNANGIELCKASRSHAIVFIAHAFKKNLDIIHDKNTRDVVEVLFKLYLNHELLEQSQNLLTNNYMSDGQVKHLKENLYNLYAILRPNAISIVDSFEFTDRELRSVIGRRDGHVYENLYKWAQQSPLNEYNRGRNPNFERYLKPLMAGERSKL